MSPVTLEDRKKELRLLLHNIQTQPSRDWTEARQRVVVLQEMIAAESQVADREHRDD